MAERIRESKYLSLVLRHRPEIRGRAVGRGTRKAPHPGPRARHVQGRRRSQSTDHGAEQSCIARSCLPARALRRPGPPSAPSAAVHLAPHRGKLARAGRGRTPRDSAAARARGLRDDAAVRAPRAGQPRQDPGGVGAKEDGRLTDCGGRRAPRQLTTAHAGQKKSGHPVAGIY